MPKRFGDYSCTISSSHLHLYCLGLLEASCCLQIQLSSPGTVYTSDITIITLPLPSVRRFCSQRRQVRKGTLHQLDEGARIYRDSFMELRGSLPKKLSVMIIHKNGEYWQFWQLMSFLNTNCGGSWERGAEARRSVEFLAAVDWWHLSSLHSGRPGLVCRGWPLGKSWAWLTRGGGMTTGGYSLKCNLQECGKDFKAILCNKEVMRSKETRFVS